MPRKGSRIVRKLSRDDAVAQYGEAAVRALGYRWDNLARGIPREGIYRLQESARVVQEVADSLLSELENNGVPLTPKERGVLLGLMRDLLALLRAHPAKIAVVHSVIREFLA